MLRPDFVRFTEALKAPCGVMHDFTPLPAEFMSAFDGPAHLASVRAVKPQITRMTPLVPWLLGAALLLALLELLVRRRGEEGDVEVPSRTEARSNARTSGRAA